MTIFQVWAPRAQKVELQLSEQVLTMDPADGGWWRSDRVEAPHGTDYGFRLDGSEPLPDPRSRWQPYGVHGLSRLFDPGRFAWGDAGWQAPPLSSAILYELHVGTFSEDGTFEGVIPRLDELKSLGVTHVELMPVAEFPGSRGWGYDGVDLFAPHRAYGGPEGLMTLVDACHRRGLAVLLDVVYNHLGPVGNYLERFGPYFTDRYATPWGKAVNLDGPGSAEVRRFFCDNALMWLRDFHIDGLRLDAVHAMYDKSALHFLEQLGREVRALSAHLGRHYVVIPESDSNDPRLVRSPDAGGFGLDAQWSDDFHHALHAYLTGERGGYYQDFGDLDQIARALSRAFVYDGSYSPHRESFHGHEVEFRNAHRFLGYAQNHDQVGNRAKGERLGHLIDGDRLKCAAALVLTSPFVPLVFQGEEWAASTPFLYFTDHEDPEVAHAVKEGRRREFASFAWDPNEIPDPQAPETYERSVLDWEERERAGHADMLDWYRRLIRLRKERSELSEGSFAQAETGSRFGKPWLVVCRGELRIAFNFGHEPAPVPVTGLSEGEILLASKEEVRWENGRLEMPPASVAVVSPRFIRI